MVVDVGHDACFVVGVKPGDGIVALQPSELFPAVAARGSLDALNSFCKAAFPFYVVEHLTITDSVEGILAFEWVNAPGLRL